MHVRTTFPADASLLPRHAPCTEAHPRRRVRTYPDTLQARIPQDGPMQQRDDAVLPAGRTDTDDEEVGPALRDAGAVVSRTEADEAAAAQARLRYEAEGLPTLAPDGAIAGELRGDELLHAQRSPAMLNRLDGAGTLPGYAGTLSLTSRRLIHIGHVTFSVSLAQIDELSVVGERLLVTLSSAEGVSLDVAGPRLLRVMIGMARKTATR